jgi:peptidoglycan/LPS O-acetylase OafA/YrhL
MFYLVMPFLIGMLRQRWLIKVAGLSAVVALTVLFHKQVAVICPSLSLAIGSYFLTGIVSYFLWKKIPAIRGKYQWSAIIAFWAAFGIGFATLGLSFKMWFTIMVMLLYTRVHSQPIRVFEWMRSVLNYPPVNFLGRISYSSYLLHWIVIEVSLFVGLHWFPQMESRVILATFCCVTVFPITYAASHLLFKYVEQPCIQLGARGIRIRRVSRKHSPA